MSAEGARRARPFALYPRPSAIGLLLVASAAGAPLGAQAVEAATTCVAPLFQSVRIWSPIGERIDPFAFPVAVTVPIGSRLTIDVATAWSTAEVSPLGHAGEEVDRGGARHTLRDMRPIPILAAALATTACGARVPVVDGVPCDTSRVVSLGDTVHHVVHATLSTEDTAAAAANRLPAEYADLVLRAVVGAIAIPARLSGPAADSVLEPISLVQEPGARSAHFVFSDPPSRLGENYSLATAISFGLRADGRLDSLAVARVSSELALTRALVVAALSADSLRSIPARPAGVDTSLARLRIALSLEERAGLAARPIFRAALPRPFDERPAPIESEVRRPSFRPRATPGQEWHTDIRFVLDESGRPLEQSIETLAATDSAWASATREAIERTRYAPAVLEGCPVKVRVVQPWSYIVR